MLPLSVIIPTYNRAALLDKTLHSLTQQTRTDFQTILVDHGSIDNTEEIYGKYKDILPISYYKIARKADEYAPAVPRDFGIRKAETPFIASLDDGMILSSHYVEAHTEFHRRHSNHVGIGLQYELSARPGSPQEDVGEDIISFLSQTDIDKARTALKEKVQLQDKREGVDLQDSHFPWSFAWTANISFPKEAYLAVGGFNLGLSGWGFEDVDLCYRISKHGLRFSFVEGGWGIELPQPRKAVPERMENHQKNMRECYGKQRSLAYESMLLRDLLLRKAVARYRALPTTDQSSVTPSFVHEQIGARFTQQGEEIFQYLTELGQDSATLPAIPERVRAQIPRPALLIGGTRRDAGQYDYVALADESVVSTPSTWSCSSVLIPLPDQSLETVVVSQIWPRLGWALHYPFGESGMDGVSLLEVLISEIKRTARRVVFIDGPSASQAGKGPSIETLVSLCHTYGLPFQIVS